MRCFLHFFFLLFHHLPAMLIFFLTFLSFRHLTTCFLFLCSLFSLLFSLPILSFISLACVWLTSLLFRALASPYVRSINLHRQACLIWVPSAFDRVLSCILFLLPLHCVRSLAGYALCSLVRLLIGFSWLHFWFLFLFQIHVFDKRERESE